MMLDLSPWQKRFFTALWLGSAAFAVGQIVAERLYEHFTRRH